MPEIEGVKEMQLDAVFEGGGVRGIAFVGALLEFEKEGFVWNNIAGTSAGAIVSSLLAAGYSGKELEGLMREFDCLALTRRRGLAKIPLIGVIVNLWIREGMFTGDYLIDWMTEKLKKKNIYTFDDLPQGKLKLIASDITHGKMLVLPDDLKMIGIDPRTFPVAMAVRMSASLPIFFEPVVLKHKNQKIYIVDGGILSNYPVWLFGDNPRSQYPTIGFRLFASEDVSPYEINFFPDYVSAMVKTMLHAHDQRYIDHQHIKHTVMIPTQGISTAQFDLSMEERDMLFRSGQGAAQQFLRNIITLRKNGKTS